MPKVEPHWTFEDGYRRADGTVLVRNKHSGGVAWWVHIAGHATPLQIRGQPHLRRFWTTPIAAMRAANKEYPPPGAVAPRRRSPPKPAPKPATPRRPVRRRGGLTKRDPFLFLGHGFGTSRKCLECYFVFRRAPTHRTQAAIVARLPAPIAVFARFRGVLLHVGSDDALEDRILTAYASPRARGEVPTRHQWQQFCSDFEEAALAIHRTCALAAVVKPDDGTYGKRTSPWHQRSIVDAARLAECAVLDDGLAINLLEDALPTWNAARHLDDASRATWLRWLDALVARRSRDRELVSELVERAAWLYGTAPAETRDALLASLRPGVRRQIVAKAQLWKA